MKKFKLFTEVKSYMRMLRALTVAYCSLFWLGADAGNGGMEGMKDNSFIEQDISSLKEEDITYNASTNTKNNELVAYAKKHPQLRNVSLVGCVDISNESIRSVAKSCPALMTLKLIFIEVNVETINCLAKYCRNLRSLTIIQPLLCEQTGMDVAIATLVENCHKLTELSLAGFKYLFADATRSIAKNCKNLTKLSLMSCPSVSSIDRIAENCPNLTELSILGCPIATKKKALTSIAEHCKNLTELSLESCNVFVCEVIKDDSIENITKGCQKLNSLLLRGASISEGWITSLHCQNLTSLRLDDTSGKKINEKVIVALANNKSLKKLKTLTFCGTKKEKSSLFGFGKKKQEGGLITEEQEKMLKDSIPSIIIKQEEAEK